MLTISFFLPVGPYIDGWTHSQVPFAVLQERLPSVAAYEEPPPYSEFPADGQVTLMRGQSPIKEELEVPDRNSVMEPLPSTQGPNNSVEFMEEGEMAPILSTSFSTVDSSHLPEYNTSLLEESFHSVGPLEHFGHPHIHSRAVFPRRSPSWSGDTSPPDLQGSWRRDSYPLITTATPTNIFPPRQDAALPPQPCYSPPPLAPLCSCPPSLVPLHSFQEARTINTNTYLTHPTSHSHTLPPPLLPYEAPFNPRTRLPPLQHHTHQHRKKVKRKRGHTWHGETPTVRLQETTAQ